MKIGMRIIIEPANGDDQYDLTKRDINYHIDAVGRAIRGESMPLDKTILHDVNYILTTIKEKLPE